MGFILEGGYLRITPANIHDIEGFALGQDRNP